MFSLKRRPGEVLRIFVPPSHAPRVILVGIDNVSGNVVKLGVKAEADVQILRPDLHPLPAAVCPR